jgi:hypothetical protein
LRDRDISLTSDGVYVFVSNFVTFFGDRTDLFRFTKGGRGIMLDELMCCLNSQQPVVKSPRVLDLLQIEGPLSPHLPYGGTAGTFWRLSTGGLQLQHHTTLVVLDEK